MNTLHIAQSEKTVPVFTVAGREFLTRRDAEAYKASLLERLGFDFYVARFGFDLTEGRGFMRHKIVAVQWHGQSPAPQNSALTWCFRNLGEPIVSFYGRPAAAWHVSEPQRFESPIELDEWLRNTRARSSSTNRFEGIVAIDPFGNALEPQPEWASA